MLNKRCNGYLGIVHSMVKSIENKFDLSLGMLLKPILDHLVVDSIESSFKIS